MNKQSLIAVAVVSAGLAGVIGFQAGLFLTRPSRVKTATEIASIKAEALEKLQAAEKTHKELEAKNMSLAKENARQISLIRDEEGLIRELNNQISEKEHLLVNLQKEKEMLREKATTKSIEQKPSQPPVTVTQLGPFNVGDLIQFPNEKYKPKVTDIIDDQSFTAMLVEPRPRRGGSSMQVSPLMSVSGLQIGSQNSSSQTDGSGPTVVFRNINTSGLVSGGWLDLKETYKVTGTTKAFGETVFVLEPVR